MNYHHNGIQIYHGCCLDVLPTLPEQSVHCCVTSPPYYGLRDYGTAKWEGGDAECDHKPANSDTGHIAHSTLGGGKATNAAQVVGRYRTCPKCGARRVDFQIGLEPTLDEFVAKMVEVFRAVWRVLRDDGTLFLNLGDSYSSGSNVCDILNGLLKNSLVVFSHARPIASSAECVDISAENQPTPDGKLTSLLGFEWKRIKQRNEDFGEILHFFTSPSNGLLRVAACGTMMDSANAKSVVNRCDDIRIVVADGNAEAQTKFAVLRTASASTGKNNKASLPVGEPSKPSVPSLVVWHTNRDTVPADAISKGVPDIYAVDNPIAFRNCFDAVACSFSDFRVAQASEKHLLLRSVGGGLSFEISDVGHLFFSMNDGSLVPYSTLYKQASQMARRTAAKQLMGMPDRVKVALQEDGWICRSTIIWHKPNPMPESVTDRPTKSHEYLFLLTKNAKYFYDAEAVREPLRPGKLESGPYPEDWHERHPGLKEGTGNMKPGGRMKSNPAGRNLRDVWKLSREDWMALYDEMEGFTDVWTIPSKSYKGAHFATFPPKLIEPCIKAGTSEEGCCKNCGAPWKRVVEKDRVATRPGRDNVNDPTGMANRDPERHVTSTKTTGWKPGCECNAGPPVPCTVLDPFMGSGTTAEVARANGCKAIGCELSAEYIALAAKRLEQGSLF